MMILPYTVYALAGQELWFVQFMLMRTRSVSVAFYARADQEPRVLQFRLVWTRSINVTFYAHADQERCAMQFRLVQAKSFVSYSLGSCGQGALVRAV
ncbi:hypothetical protein ACFX2C_005999 [Malus domestica]